LWWLENQGFSFLKVHFSTNFPEHLEKIINPEKLKNDPKIQN
jgi:hypothetical protein